MQCNIYDKMKDIKNKYIIKAQNEDKEIYFLYNGDKINEELTFSQQVNERDRKIKKMNILVFEEEEKNDIKQNEIKSKEVICPDCGENALIQFKDNKIDLYGCKNGHNNNLLYEEFEKTQKIDLSKIKCDKCKEQNINDMNNNEFYICSLCKKKFCEFCKSIKDKNQNIINYNKENCKENNCMPFKKENKSHNNTIIFYAI